jgi:hypothetical protein
MHNKFEPIDIFLPYDQIQKANNHDNCEEQV